MGNIILSYLPYDIIQYMIIPYMNVKEIVRLRIISTEIKNIIHDENFEINNIDEWFLGMCKNGQNSLVAILLKDKRIDPCYKRDYPLQKACENGHHKIVKYLLNDKRIQNIEFYIIYIVCKHGYH